MLAHVGLSVGAQLAWHGNGGGGGSGGQALARHMESI